MIRVALVQVVGGVGGGGGLGRGRGAAAQRPPPVSRVRAGVGWRANHPVERHLGGFPGAARAPQGTLKYFRLETGDWR